MITYVEREHCKTAPFFFSPVLQRNIFLGHFIHFKYFLILFLVKQRLTEKTFRSGTDKTVFTVQSAT